MEFKQLSDKGWGKTSPKENASTSEKKSSQYGTKLPVKYCHLQVGPACASQLLPCSCRDVRAIRELQRLDGLRLRQHFQQICNSIQALAILTEAPVLDVSLNGI